MIDQEAQEAAQRGKVLMTKTDRRAILRALSKDILRLSRTPTYRQSVTLGFLSSRAMELAEVRAAYDRIKAVDEDALPHRIVEVRGGTK